VGIRQGLFPFQQIAFYLLQRLVAHPLDGLLDLIKTARANVQR
jgi:hypothetical protein